MSRLQAGAMSVVRRPVALDEVVALALDDLGAAGLHIVVDVPADLPVVLADPGLLAPFQRLGDTDNTTGIGLGLALSRGLTEAMGGTLSPEESPGGGLTMVVSLPAAPALLDPSTPAQPGLRERAKQERPSVTGQDNA